MEKALLCLWLWRCWLIVFLFPSFSLQQQIDVFYPLYLQCLRNSSTSLSNTFTRNLNATLTNFTSLALEGSSYEMTTSGSSSSGDTVYAVFQCRGDLSQKSCGVCVQNITALLPQTCPDSLGARIRVDGCFLRYDNQSFFTLDTSSVVGLCNTMSATDELTLQAISNLMENVTTEAPQRSSRYASASSNGIFAMAQCMRYLNQSECSQCLIRYSYSELCGTISLGKRLILASCEFRYEAYNFMEAPSPPALAPARSPSPSPSRSAAMAPTLPAVSSPPSPTGSKTPIIAASVAGGVIVVAGTLCVILSRRHKAIKKKGVKRLGSWPLQLLESKAHVFSVEELEEATDHFNPKNKLGEGGFGIVYKGTLSNGERVAIKKLSVGSQQGRHEFLNEVNLITSVQHKNLIRLLGCCVDETERILVYEYLPNKSLDFFLSEARGNRMLNWSTRYDIVVGMAKGLTYLHEESHIRIIHRDIKPSNILLDDQLNPVIADFGLARLVKDNATHVNTAVAGTRGYLAPEYALCGALSEKVDVFSFGLVSLEVITGKQNSFNMLLAWVWEKYREGKVVDLVDARLAKAFSPDQAVRVVHAALLCTQENPKQRPTMSMVTLWLSGTSDILELPIRPTFLDYNNLAAPTGEFNHQFVSTSSSSSQFDVYGGQLSGGVQSMSGIVDPR